MTTRNINLDIMRLLGLGIIMLAHSFPPDWLFQLRNFGTPLLIIASALTFSHIYENKKIEIKSFYKRRISRLIVPMYIFLSVFFAFFLTLGALFEFDTGFDLKTIALSYLMVNGIGFVWIFKIYLILTIITPLAIYLMKSKVTNSEYFTMLIFIYALYEVIASIFIGIENKYLQVVIFKFLLLAIPYSLLFLYGVRLNTLSNKTIIYVSSTSLIIFILVALYLYSNTGNFTPTQEYKYPPRFYYLIYAFFAIHLIYFFVKRIKVSSPRRLAIISFLSKNSLWIYLWHIFAYYIWQFSLPEIKYNLFISIVMMSYLFIFAIFMTFIQLKLVNSLLNKSKNTNFKYFYEYLK